jgi:hypothetical protein
MLQRRWSFPQVTAAEVMDGGCGMGVDKNDGVKDDD